MRLDDDASERGETSGPANDGRSLSPGRLGIRLLVDGPPPHPTDPLRRSRELILSVLQHWKAEAQRCSACMTEVEKALREHPSDHAQIAFADAQAKWRSAVLAVDACARELRYD